MIQNTIEIKEKVKEYIIETAYAASEAINEKTLIFKEGYFDSMGFVMLISFLNEEFGIEVMDSELVEENFESIASINNFILKKLN